MKQSDYNKCYLAAELSKQSTSKLLSAFTLAHPRQFAHHATLAFNITPADLVTWPLNEAVTIYVLTHAVDSRVQAVRVSILNETLRLDKKHLHVTISVAEHAAPVDSNKILLELFEPVNMAPLVGIIKLIPKR
jgi:hypothetical protein